MAEASSANAADAPRKKNTANLMCIDTQVETREFRPIIENFVALRRQRLANVAPQRQKAPCRARSANPREEAVRPIASKSWLLGPDDRFGDSRRGEAHARGDMSRSLRSDPHM